MSDFETSKTLNYLDSSIQGPYFGFNILVWIYLRHYINIRILISLLTEFRSVGPYELNWETQQYKCWISNIITFALLASLQALNLFWLYCLFRSAYKYLVYNIAKDDRSEAEESETEDLDKTKDETRQMVTEKAESLMVDSTGIEPRSKRNGHSNDLSRASGPQTARSSRRKGAR